MSKCLVIILSIQIIQIYITASLAQKATQTESPWAVWISVSERICGGALIADKHVLTAANCFDYLKASYFNNLEKLNEAVKIKFGEWKTDTDPDCSEDSDTQLCDRTADIPPNKIILHPAYKKSDREKRYMNDIAIIELVRPPRKSELVTPIRLAGRSRCNADLTGERWMTTGFGKNKYGGVVQIKKKSEIEIISNAECIKRLTTDQTDKFAKNIHVCGILQNNKTTCDGDSGNAATNIIESIPYLQGLVTYVDECTAYTKETPSLLLRVSCFFDWIISIVPSVGEFSTEKSKVIVEETIKHTDTGIEVAIVRGWTEPPFVGTTIAESLKNLQKNADEQMTITTTTTSTTPQIPAIDSAQVIVNNETDSTENIDVRLFQSFDY